jgi:prepilin-type N-terminal cleavage/methylation domain-containing protein
MKRCNQQQPNGFTLIELIAVIVILSILTYVASSSYRNWNEESKKKAAMMEMKQIADAEKQVEAQYGYYLPLTVLDDMASVPSGISNADLISDHANYLIIDPVYGGNPAAGYVRTIRDMLAGTPMTSSDTVLTYKWKGPYLEYQPDKKYNPSGTIGAELPLDPWHGEYHFLSINGSEIDFEGQVGGTGFSNSTIGRWALVSFGKDSTQGTDDDLYYTFN